MHDHRRPDDAGHSKETPGTAAVKTGRPARPQPLAPDFAGVPADLRAETAWVTWRYQFRDGRDGAAGAWTKIPLTASTGHSASSTDASTWDTFAAACAAYDRGGVDGIGFVFAEDGPFFGVDLDKCARSEDGRAVLDDDAAAVLDTLRTYAEWSPSGTGVHLIGRGDLPPGARRRGTVEMYDRGRYFTVTGHPVDDRPAEVRDVSAALRLVHAGLFPTASPPSEASRPSGGAGLGLSDVELVEKATGAKNGGEFARLYYGGGKSEARASLLARLAFWTNGDAGQMERLLRASAFNGPRLDERRGAETFAAYEVRLALGRWDGWDGTGYTARAVSAPAADPPFTVEAFVEALGDAKGKDVERAALRLADKAARASSADVAKMLAELEERGAGVKWQRDWRSDVRAQARENRAHATNAREMERENRGPAGLKGGALNEWLADQLRAEAGGFAKDPGGALYRYDAARGHYVGPCEAWVAERVRETMKAVGSMEGFGKARAEAVVYDLATTAEDLWETPPAGRLCLLNGVLNLDTCELEPHRPGAWLSTFGLPILYDPEAGAEARTWKNYFASVLPDDARGGWGFELVRWLLSPAAGKRPALLLHGPGDDGKSTFLGLLSHVLGGKDGRAVSATTLQTLGSDRFGPADLYGAALNICADLPAAPLDGVDVFKRITGGDLVRAERKYGDAFNFRPSAHLLFSSNHPIRLRDGADDRAFWGRWIVVPFTNNFGEGSPDRRQLDAIRADLLTPCALSALLNAALACGDSRGGPPSPSPSMEDTLDAMRHGRRSAPVSHGSGDGGGDGDRTPRRSARRNAPLPTTFQTESNGTPPPGVPNGKTEKVVGTASEALHGGLPSPVDLPAASAVVSRGSVQDEADTLARPLPWGIPEGIEARGHDAPPEGDGYANTADGLDLTFTPDECPAPPPLRDVLPPHLYRDHYGDADS